MPRKKNEEPVEAEVVNDKKETKSANVAKRSDGKIFWGFLLIAIGGIFIAENFVSIDLWRYFWPLVLVFLGLMLIVRSTNY